MDDKDRRIMILEKSLRERDEQIKLAKEALDRIAKKENGKSKKIKLLQEGLNEYKALTELGFQGAKDTVKFFSGEPVPDSLKIFHKACQKKFYAFAEKYDQFR